MTQQKLDWATIAQLLLKYSLPFVAQLLAKMGTGADPTLEDIQELQALVDQRAKDKMLAVLQAQNIDPASDQGKALLELARG